MKTMMAAAATGALLVVTQLCRGADPLDSWTLQRIGNNNYFTSVAFGGGQFVVTGFDTNLTSFLLTSTDGVNWTPGNSGTTNILNDVTYGQGQFVAVGDHGTIIHSPDGTNWTEAISGTTNLLTTVAYGNDQFIAAGFRSILYSGLSSSAVQDQRAGGTELPDSGVHGLCELGDADKHRPYR